MDVNMKVDITKKVKNNIELPQMDITKYIGTKAIIESVGEYKGAFGYFIKVMTKVVDIIPEILDKETNKPLELRASRIFGLAEGKDGEIGWNDKMLLGIFLKKMGVKHYKDLVGKEVILQSVLNKKDGKDYLSF